MTARALIQPRRWVWLGLAAVVLLGGYLGAGFYTVEADEQAVVRRFGAITARVGPGIHYRLPWPIDQVDVLKTTSVMQTGVGFVWSDDQGQPAGIDLLSGDTNIVGIALVLQYIVANPADFLFRIDDSKGFIDSLAESALTETVIGMPVDEVLTTGRLAIQEVVKTSTQAMLDRHQSGVQIISANIQSMSLDKSVAEAFQDVTDALADREKARNAARIYTNNLLPKARGEAHALIRSAEGDKRKRIAAAEGRSGRFLAVLEEYQKASDVTRTRLYLDAMEAVLPRVKMYVIDSDGGTLPVNLRVRAP